MKRSLLILLIIVSYSSAEAQRLRAREYGIKIGVLPTGKWNTITDVKGVRVGHTTVMVDDKIHTGVTAILPHEGNLFQQKVPAAVVVGNGFGKLAGSTQVQELGNIETPIILTNTLSVSTAMDAVIEYTLNQQGNEKVQSVNAVVGETNDGGLNDIRGRHVTKEHVLQAIKTSSQLVAEGNVGAGTGTVCFGFKGGIGTSSRVLPENSGGYTVGVLVQTNFGGVLQIDGVPIGEELKQFYLRDQLSKGSEDGSCMIVVATDAPVDSRNLERMAKRAIMGLAKTGGIASNGSGDYVIAFSSNPALQIAHSSTEKTQAVTLLRNDEMSALFMAVIEATEEAIINSLFKAETTMGNGRTIKSLPIEDVVKFMKKYNAVK